MTAPAPVDAWRRLHPISPALRSWKLLVGLLVVYGNERLRGVFFRGGDPTPLGSGPLGGATPPDLRELLLASVAVTVIVVVGSALGVASWWMTRYLVDDEAVRLHSGVVFRQQRSAQLDRVQAVDVVRPLLARLLGFAEVRVEVAGGAGSGIRLAYLRRPEAERLQAALLARAQQRGAGDADAAGDDDGGVGAGGGAAEVGTEQGAGAAGRSGPARTAGPVGAGLPVLSVPFGRLAGSIALGTAPLVLLGLLAVLVAVVALTDSPAPLLAMGPALLGTGAGIVRSLTQGGAWSVESTREGLRLRHGLLERRSQTIPRGRVQAVRITQPPLWRLVGWWRMQVNVAGYSLEGGDTASSTQVVPVATRAQVDQLLVLVLPALVGHSAAGSTAVPGVGADVQEGLVGSARQGWTTSPRRARLLDPLGWRRQGLRATPVLLLVRRGRWWRTLDVVPHGRTQSLALVQGPWQRRLRLATFVVHSTPGPVQPVAAHLDAGEAGAVVLAQAARALTAAAAEGPRAPVPPAPVPPVAPGAGLLRPSA